MGDTQDETLMLQKLVQYYQRPEDWRSLLTLSAGHSTDDHLEFGYLRLRYDLGLLNEPDRYEALIFESLQAGMLAKAKAVLAQAEERGVFSVDRAERLQHAISREALDPDRQLSHALNEAQRDSTGESDAVAGQIYLGEARYPQAIQAFQRSLRKGSLRDPDEIRIDLGIASLRNHQPDLARAVFSQVSPASDWATLARLWSIRLDDQSPKLKS
jgi:tetratricopeptide (TPR) repeat protein